MDWQKLLELVAEYYGEYSAEWTALAKNGLNAENCYQILRAVPGVSVIVTQVGKVLGYSFSSTAATAASASTVTAAAATGSAIASSGTAATATATATATAISVPAEMTVAAETATVTATAGATTATGTIATTAIGTLGWLTAAVAAAGAIGWGVDKALYEANPEYWESLGYMDPSKWAEFLAAEPDNPIGKIVYMLRSDKNDSGETTGTVYVPEDVVSYASEYIHKQHTDGKDVVSTGYSPVGVWLVPVSIPVYDSSITDSDTINSAVENILGFVSEINGHTITDRSEAISLIETDVKTHIDSGYKLWDLQVQQGSNPSSGDAETQLVARFVGSGLSGNIEYGSGTFTGNATKSLVGVSLDGSYSSSEKQAQSLLTTIENSDVSSAAVITYSLGADYATGSVINYKMTATANTLGVLQEISFPHATTQTVSIPSNGSVEIKIVSPQFGDDELSTGKFVDVSGNVLDVPSDNSTVFLMMGSLSAAGVYGWYTRDLGTFHYSSTGGSNSVYVNHYSLNTYSYFGQVTSGTTYSGLTRQQMADKCRSTIAFTSYSTLSAGTTTTYGVTLPNGITWNDFDGVTDSDTMKAKLKELNPDLWDKAITNTFVDENGDTKTVTYLPSPIPSTDDSGNPTVDPDTDPEYTPDKQPDSSGANEVITGVTDDSDGVNPGDDTPVVTPISGTADSLYSVYNPTITQIKDFGKWLWSSDFVDQILKLFSDPMQAIIGLHRVYVTPVTGSAQNIKVGYLDSGVSSKIVTNQYVTVDLGSVTLVGKYGNAFDYSSDVYIYLPFLGITRLSTSEVMNSVLGVVYYVDVTTGATLINITVTKNAHTYVAYTYQTNCSEQVPLSSGSYIGIINGVMSLAGSIGAAVATGGSAIPMVASSALGAMSNGTQIEKSGSLSGNAGAMGGKTPYILRQTKNPIIPSDISDYQPTSYISAKLSTCSGYTEVEDINFTDASGLTDQELNEIETELKTGVIF